MSELFEHTKTILSSLTTIGEAILDELARSGNTVLIEKGIFKKSQDVPQLQGGWRAQIITDYTDDDNAEVMGKVVLFYGATDKKGLWEEGQLKKAMEAGLSEEHAKAWLRSRVAYKHDNLGALVEILASEKLTTAYMEYPLQGTYEQQGEWMRKHNITGRVPRKVRGGLAQLVQECMTGKRIQRQPVKKETVVNPAMSKALQEALARGTLATHADTSDAEIDSAINGNAVEGGEEVAVQRDETVAAEVLDGGNA